MSKLIKYQLDGDKFKIHQTDYNTKTVASIEIPIGEFLDMVGELVETGNPVFKMEAKGSIKVD